MLLTGPKPPGYPALPHPGSDDRPGESYENVELENKPIAENEQQMVYVNVNDAQKQDNAPVSKILAHQALE